MFRNALVRVLAESHKNINMMVYALFAVARKSYICFRAFLDITFQTKKQNYKYIKTKVTNQFTKKPKAFLHGAYVLSGYKCMVSVNIKTKH